MLVIYKCLIYYEHALHGAHAYVQTRAITSRRQGADQTATSDAMRTLGGSAFKAEASLELQPQ